MEVSLLPLARVTTEFCPPANSYVEALTINMTVFGDKAFKEVIKVE